MTKEEYIEVQKKERTAITKAILESKAPKKLIVAGAGTGKTFTFSEVLKLATANNPEGARIAMTFIRLLRNDMAGSLAAYADVRTFHEFCKKFFTKNEVAFFFIRNSQQSLKKIQRI